MICYDPNRENVVNKAAPTGDVGRNCVFVVDDRMLFAVSSSKKGLSHMQKYNNDLNKWSKVQSKRSKYRRHQYGDVVRSKYQKETKFETKRKSTDKTYFTYCIVDRKRVSINVLPNRFAFDSGEGELINVFRGEFARNKSANFKFILTE